MTGYFRVLQFLILVVGLGACSSTTPVVTPVQIPPASPTPTAVSTATATPAPPRALIVCTGPEPESLLPWLDDTLSGRAIRAAIYEAPILYQDFIPQPGLVQEIPLLANGGVRYEAVPVQVGEAIIDAGGQAVLLSTGVEYYPSGCHTSECLESYQDQGEILVDQMVVVFTLRSGLFWSDGAPLTAQDSMFAYETAGAVYPRLWADRLRKTSSYTVDGDTRIEWRGIPGFSTEAYLDYIFTPLPEHAWRDYEPEMLLSLDGPMGGEPGSGAYRLAGWEPGDHIELEINPHYQRLATGSPAFEHLVFRFVNNGVEALQALQIGECDLALPGLITASDVDGLESGAGLTEIQLFTAAAGPWEQLAFGIVSADPERISPVNMLPVRQAIALCLDRDELAAAQVTGQAMVVDSYLHPDHPVYEPEASIAYDPQAAAEMLSGAGWVDADGAAETPRVAQGIAGIADGTALRLGYLTLDIPARRTWGETIRQSLSRCGIGIELSYLPAEELFAPGPQGPLFGRSFDLAQFGWEAALQPPCYLYSSAEIPGPYPEFAPGWGGANLTGYASPAFDQGCRLGMRSLPEQSGWAAGHREAQRIYSRDLPSLPLFIQPVMAAARADLCGFQLSAGSTSWLPDMTRIDYGEGCSD